ncbi:MAG TPA: maleylpyruvate isomerase N-terminal domain-containing protein [Methylomirabilota bacterium]|nr:maleylpyruvate isomerase N-terminal domain-containing protein [Methylomirabilota bacterium]
MEGFEPAVTEVAQTGHTPEEESDMGAKGEALAKQFEVKAHESWAYVEKLGDADLKKVTEAEKWTVAATAHHLFGAYDRVPDIAKGLAAGRSPANFSTKVLDQMNAQHAKDFAACSKADLMAAYRAGSAKAASTLRGLSDEELVKSGVIFQDAPPFTVEQLVTRALIAHTDEHMGSIRKTVGK